MSLHSNLIEADVHALPAKVYADVTARNADTGFQVTSNINKMVRVDSPQSYYLLASVGPAAWIEVSNVGKDEFIDLIDTPSSYSGDTGKVVQVNAGEIALEFGQQLRTTDSPQFNDLQLAGNLTVQGTTTTLDTTTLLVEDKNIELGVVGSGVPTDITADGGGITLRAPQDKKITWKNLTDSWNFNQDVIAEVRLVVGGTAAPATDASVDLKATNKALLYNRLTTVQRDALTVLRGMAIYNTDTDDIEFFNGVAWQSMFGGDVTGPASSTDNAIARFNGPGGKNIQNSSVLIDDLGNVQLAPSGTLYQETYGSDESLVLSLDFRDVFDRSPPGNDAVLEGAAVVNNAAGRIGSGLRLDGTAGTIARIANNASLQFTDVITVEAWIFPNTDGAGFESFVSKMDSGLGKGWNFTYQSNGLRVTFRGTAGISDTFNILGGQVPTGIWTHVAMTFDSANQLKIYINGVLRDTRTFSLGPWDDSTDDLVVGARLNNGAVINPFNGDITGVRVYNRVMAADEIRVHYLRHSNYASQSALVADRFKVVDTLGNAWIDFSPNATGGVNTVGGRKLFGTPNNVVYFTDASDLPAPVGGVITLEINTVYVMYNDDPTTSQKPILFADRIQVPDTGGCRITGIGLATALLIYTGTGTFITTSSNFTGFLHIDELFISCPNGTLFNIDGVLPVGSEFFPRIFLSNMGVFNTDTLGTIKTISVNFNVGAFFSCKQGLVLDGIDEALIGDWRFANWQNDVGSIMLTAKNQLRFPKIQNCTFETTTNETAFDISPSIGDEPFIMSGNSYRGNGTLYAVGTSGTITSVINVAHSGSVTAVQGTPFGEVIMTDVAHALKPGQFITTSGFADPNYNGTFEVLEVIDADNFRIHTLFTATGTGTWDSNKIQFFAANTLLGGDGVTVTGTANYDAGYRVLGVSPSAFFVNGTFVATDTGSFNTDGLTEADPRMRVVANAGMPGSRALGVFSFNDNVDETTIIQDTYVEIDITNLIAGSNIERFSVADVLTGKLQYDGLEPFEGTLTATFHSNTLPAQAEYRFAVSINDAVPIFASATYMPLSLKAVGDSVNLVLPVSMVTGDTVKIMIAGDGSSVNVTIAHGQLSIQ